MCRRPSKRRRRQSSTRRCECADSDELIPRRRGLANNRVGIRIPNSNVIPIWRSIPNRRRSVGSHPAAVDQPGAYGREFPLWRRSLAEFVIAVQAIEPLVLTPQLWAQPALTVVNCPSGGEACPYVSSPQQATAPSTVTPQVLESPALTEESILAGRLRRQSHGCRRQFGGSDPAREPPQR